MEIYQESLNDELVKLGKRPAGLTSEETEPFAFLGKLVNLSKSGTELRVLLPQNVSSVQIHAMTLLDNDPVRSAEAFHNIVSAMARTAQSWGKAQAETARKYRRWDFEKDDGRPLISGEAYDAKVLELVKLDVGVDYRPEFNGLAIMSKDDLVAFAATISSQQAVPLLRVTVCKLKDFLSTAYIGKSEIGVSFNAATSEDLLKGVQWAVERGKVQMNWSQPIYSIEGLGADQSMGYRYALCSYVKAPSLAQVLAKLSKNSLYSFEHRTLQAALAQ